VALALLLKRSFDDDLWARGYVEVAAGMAAFLGHLFPVYLRFRGGKGVAAGLGAVSLLLPVPTLAGLFVWLILLAATRYMSLASIAAVLALCAVHLRQPAAWDWGEPRTWFCLVAGALVIVKHRGNIQRLFQGTENQIRDTIVMHQLSKSLHTLALGLWFGMTVFFTFVVALSLLNSFQTLGKSEERHSWFPLSPMYAENDAELNGPEEQGTRAFGHAVSPLFPWYYALQGACGFIALATSFSLIKSESRVHRWRLNLLLAAVVFVLAGWPVERKVEQLRVPRNQTTEEFLLSRFVLAQSGARQRTPEEERVLREDLQAKTEAMKDARGEFFKWHTYSLLLNFATILCVTAAMAMAGNLENGSTKDTKGHEEEKKAKEAPATA
jgi:acyl-phosphate glycerol 3-phosphate acyltransferase